MSRHIGRGMKGLRGMVSKIAGGNAAEKPTAEGQAEGALEPVLEQVEQVQSDNTSNAKSEEIDQKPEEIVEGSEDFSLASSANEENDASADTLQEPSKEGDDLLKALGESKYAAPMTDGGMAMQPAIIYGKAGELGPQSDGSYIWPVKIDQEYAEAVKEWAADRGSVEEWLYDLVRANLESYGSAPKGR